MVIEQNDEDLELVLRTLENVGHWQMMRSSTLALASLLSTDIVTLLLPNVRIDG